MAPQSVLLPGKSHEWRSLAGQSMGSLRVKNDWATSLSLFTFMHWRRKWQPTPVFLPGESQGRGSLVGCRLWVTQSQTRLKWLSSSSIWHSKWYSLSYNKPYWKRIFKSMYTHTHTHTHTHICIHKLGHIAVHQKLIQHCKSTILQ